MKFNVKTDSIFVRPNVPLRKGVVDFEKIVNMKNEKVKITEDEVLALCKKYPADIEVYEETEASEDKGGEAGTPATPPANQPAPQAGTQAPAGQTAEAPKAYDDITANEMKDFLKGKGHQGDLPDDKKELYKLYEAQFKPAQ